MVSLFVPGWGLTVPFKGARTLPTSGRTSHVIKDETILTDHVIGVTVPRGLLLSVVNLVSGNPFRPGLGPGRVQDTGDFLTQVWVWNPRRYACERVQDTRVPLTPGLKVGTVISLYS